MGSDATNTTYTPNLLAALPLLYVVWADGELTAAEIAAVRGTYLSAATDLSADEQLTLSSWLDETNPPSPATLADWFREIRRLGNAVDGRSLLSLGQFGEAITQVDYPGDIPSETIRAIDEVSELLGVSSASAINRFGAEQRVDRASPLPGVSAASLDRFLNSTRREIRSSILQLLSLPDFKSHPDRIEEYREWVLARIKDIAELGLGGLAFPVRFGGQNDIRGFIAAFEALALGDLSVVVKYGVQFGLFGGSIHQLGTERHHAAYLQRISEVALPGCFAMSESGHGSNVRDILTTARYDPDTAQFVLNTPVRSARKDWIGNAAMHGRLAVVFAQLQVNQADYGVHAFVTPIRDPDGVVLPGVSIEDCGRKVGLNGVDNGQIAFANVRIPVGSLLDRFASITDDGHYSSPIASEGRRFFTMLGTLVGGRISVACGGLSATKTALSIATRYAASRVQFGPKGGQEVPLLSYRTHRRRLLPAIAKTYGLHFALHNLADRFAASHTDEEQIEIEVLAAALKATATWHTTETIQGCREACGGQGYLEVNRFAALKADTDVFTTFEGDNTVLMLQVAKGLLTSFRQQFHDMNWLMIARFAAERASATIKERNPIVARKTSRDHLRSAEFQISILEAREQDLLRSLARRLKSRIDGGMDSFDAFIECQDHMVSLARAYAERVIIDEFVRAAANSPREINLVLDEVRQLTGLCYIEQDRGWFQEQGLIEAGKSKAIRSEVNVLCDELASSAVDLVDGFGIPDVVLRAPIASRP